MVEKIVRKIKSLPPLPESVERVRQICNDPEGTIKDLVPVVKQDPMFTADILKAANSPLYGFSRQITSIDQAISLFGMGTIQGFAISYAIRKSFPIDLSPYGRNSEDLMRISASQNALTMEWSKSLIDSHESEMMTISLLMELGKVVASLILIEEGKEEEFRQEAAATKSTGSLSECEKRYLDITSEWIAALMFKHWKFHDSMVEMMRHIHEPEKAPETLRRHTQILNLVKEAIPFMNPLCEECIQSAYKKAEMFGLDADGLRKAVEKIETGR